MSIDALTSSKIILNVQEAQLSSQSSGSAQPSTIITNPQAESFPVVVQPEVKTTHNPWATLSESHGQLSPVSFGPDTVVIQIG